MEEYIKTPVLYKHTKGKIFGELSISNKEMVQLIKSRISIDEPLMLYPGATIIKDKDGTIVDITIHEFSIM